VIAIEQPATVRGAHLPDLLAKKSRSTISCPIFACSLSISRSRPAASPPLPAPKFGDFSLYVRAYWPKVAVTDGSWTQPPVERNDAASGSSTAPASGSK
jgi:hypothetical protein